jgi:hypothetical protein
MGIGARGGHKLRGLGNEVLAGDWADMDSVDGLGKVRAWEVILYWWVARGFLKVLLDESPNWLMS